MFKHEEYKTSIVAYLDLLGFKEHVNGLSKNKKALKKMAMFFEKINGTFQEFKESKEEWNLGTINFSDSIIVYAPTTLENHAEEEEEIFLKIVLFVASIQFWYLLILELPVRGAITKGEFYHSGKTFFGEALNTAYALESKEAFYPRVILPSELASSYNLPYLEETNNNKFTFPDIGNFYSVDFLSFICSSIHDLEKIKIIIEKNINSPKIRSNTNIYNKWHYLGRYFNNTVFERRFRSDELQGFNERINLTFP